MVQINLVVIKTDKIEAQKSFYSALGIEFDYHRHGTGPFHYASKGMQPVLELYPLPKGVEQPDQTTRLGFGVTSLDQLINELTLLHVKIIKAPRHSEWGYSAVVEDFDGRKIELTEIS